MIRAATKNETQELIQVAVGTGIFKPNEAEELLGGVLSEFHLGKLGEGHFIEVLLNAKSQKPAGWVYYSPSFKAEGVWDLWWIGVDSTAQRSGFGQKLLEHVEASVAKNGGRLLIIETSSLSNLEPARNFYLKHGYAKCGQVPSFYGKGDDKIIFAKSFN